LSEPNNTSDFSAHGRQTNTKVIMAQCTHFWILNKSPALEQVTSGKRWRSDISQPITFAFVFSLNLAKVNLASDQQKKSTEFGEIFAPVRVP